MSDYFLDYKRGEILIEFPHFQDVMRNVSSGDNQDEEEFWLYEVTKVTDEVNNQ